MNRFAVLIAVLAVSSVSSVFAAPKPTDAPKPTTAPLQRAYVPEGFDSNDVVTFVVEGAFPNTCYRPGFVGVTGTRRGSTIEVASTAYVYPGPCYDVVVPFNQTVSLPPLPPGRYRVAQAGSSATLGSLSVATARSAFPDEEVYAPISQAVYQQTSSGGQVTLSGTFSAVCMHLGEVKVTVERTALVVQPIAHIDRERPCAPGSIPFQRTVQVPPMPRGRYVLHVRSMNGNAINTLFDVR